MKIIGCLCFATLLPKHDKFSPRAVKAVLVGYGTTQKGFKLYNLDTKQFFISRDVVFMEAFQETISAEQMSTTPNIFAYDDLVSVHPPNIDILMNSYPIITAVSPITSSSAPELNSAVVSSIEPTFVSVRKSVRSTKLPTWHNDYVTTAGSFHFMYSIASSIDYSNLSPAYQSFFSKFSIETEPTTYREALKDPKCIEAIQCEIKALEDNNTW